MEGLVLKGFIIHDFPLLSVVLQFEFESVIGLIVITPFAPATIGLNIGLVIPLAVSLPKIGFTIF